MSMSLSSFPILCKYLSTLSFRRVVDHLALSKNITWVCYIGNIKPVSVSKRLAHWRSCFGEMHMLQYGYCCFVCKSGCIFLKIWPQILWYLSHEEIKPNSLPLTKLHLETNDEVCFKEGSGHAMVSSLLRLSWITHSRGSLSVYFEDSPVACEKTHVENWGFWQHLPHN